MPIWRRRKQTEDLSGETNTPDRVLSRDTDPKWSISQYIDTKSELFQKKGLEVVDEMVRRDGQVKNSYFIRRLCLLATARDFVAADETPEAIEQKEFIDEVFERMEGSVEDFLFKFTDAIRCGFKLAELVWTIIPDGRFAGKVGLKKLLVRNSANYAFDCEEDGTLKADGIVEGPGTQWEQRLPREKFVLWSYGRFDDDATSLYGMSEFEAAYNYYFRNDLMLKLWSLSLEKSARPIWLVRVKEGMSAKPTQVSALTAVLNASHRKNVIAIPEWADVTVQDPPTTKEKEFSEFMHFGNQMISKSLLLGTLIQQEGAASGSYSLGKKQFDLFYANNAQIMGQIEETVFNEQIIRRLIDLNFDKPVYPKFKLIDDDDDPAMLEAKAKILAYLRGIPGLNLREEEIREYIGLKKLDSDDGEGKPKGPGGHVPDGSGPNGAGAGPGGGRGDGSGMVANRFAEGDETPPRAESIYWREKFPAEEVVRFGEIAKVFDQIPQIGAVDLADAYRDAVAKAVGKAEEILADKDYAAIAKLTIAPAGIEKAYSKLMTRAFIRGLQLADDEVLRHETGSPQSENRLMSYAVIGTGIEIDTADLDLVVPISEADLAAAASKLTAQAVLSAKADATKLEKAVRFLIMQAVEENWTPDRLGMEMATLGATKAQEAQVMTALRNATSKTFNEARRQLYKKSDQVAGYMFSAILDQNTCFPGDVKVETGQGPKEISGVAEGEMVLTHKGNQCRVLAKTASNYKGKMIRIRAGDTELVCSESHRIYCEIDGQRKFIPAGEIRQGVSLICLKK